MKTSLKFAVRAAQIKDRLGAMGISQAEASRQIGYPDESGRVYVRRILSAMDTSNVVLDKIEALLDEHEKAEAA